MFSKQVFVCKNSTVPWVARPETGNKAFSDIKASRCSVI